jgi:hypothetical protein
MARIHARILNQVPNHRQMTVESCDLHQVLTEVVENVEALAFMIMQISKNVNVSELGSPNNVSLLVYAVFLRVITTEKLDTAASLCIELH